ncbi:MAG: Gfo/Idh/MocA family oxidoreductase [Sedimentisphaerales bacterium]|nr:Gfo/Idh/MocA family oxidoreductase [Sedimentisphaerales bacterium]
MKTWNFGIIGAGLIADFHARAINDIPNAKLIGCCDKITDKAKQLAQKYQITAFENYDEMLKSDEIDIVTIATPSGLHAEPAIAAAKAGKHVLCEKPLDITLERIDSMIEAHEKSGTYLGGIFPYRFNDYVVPLRKAIDAGRFGTINYTGVYVPWWRTDEYYKDSWHGTWDIDGGGALMNQSIHMVDMICDLLAPVESVQAFTATLGHKMEAEDTAAAVLRFKSGTLGIIYGTTASFPGQFRRFEITGTKGTVINVENTITTWQFADKRPEDKEILTKYGKIEGGGGVADPAAITHENHARNFNAFLKALDEKKKFKIDGLEARKAVELILAIYQSAKEQRIVRLS